MKSLVEYLLKLIVFCSRYIQNILLVLALYTPFLIGAIYFEQFYLAEQAALNPLNYILGYSLGTFAISISVYLGYVRNLDTPIEIEERIVQRKILASTLGASMFISSIRWAPILLEKLGYTLSGDFLIRLSLQLIYLIPATGLFLFYRNNILYNDITAQNRIFRTLKDYLNYERQKFLKEHSDEEVNIEEFEKSNVEIPVSEILDITKTLPILVILMGLTTLAVELYLPGLTLLDLIKTVLTLSVVNVLINMIIAYFKS